MYVYAHQMEKNIGKDSVFVRTHQLHVKQVNSSQGPNRGSDTKNVSLFTIITSQNGSLFSSLYLLQPSHLRHGKRSGIAAVLYLRTFYMHRKCSSRDKMLENT